MCIFCKIIAKEIPAEIVKETEDILVIKDIYPKAPVHLLIIPKKHIENVGALQDSDLIYASKIFSTARDLAKGLAGSQSFRLIMNNGQDSGQSVFHMHCHFLSGKKMLDF